MKILAFDSTAKIASVSVTENDREIATFNVNNGLTQSELLLPMAEDLLRRVGISFADIDVFSATMGPGSFTGVRIGAALIKGLAFGRSIPCVEVSTLDSLAENLVGTEGIIVPVMDARRNQVYTATFKGYDGKIERLTEDRAISISELAESLKEYSAPIYLVGDGYTVAKAGLLKDGVTTADTPPILINENAYSTARVAYRKYLAGEITSDKDVTPTYLRVPQAERERLEKLKSEENKNV